jgi:peptide/nickel transport system ATP-binding protein
VSDTSSLLEVRDLRVTYRTRAGEVPVVRGVSFDLQTAGTLGLAGESGCGKTTIANAVLRLLPPGTRVEGQVLLEGEDVYTMNPGRLRAVRWSELAVVFQGALHSLDPVQKVGKQIAEAIDLHTTQSRALTKARVGDLLEQVGMPARRGDDYPHQLSGGQRQRVMIAMALACDPAVLIADEPTTALDVMVQAQVLDLLQRLQRERNLAVLFITHDLSVLTYVCENLAVMYAGRIVEEGRSGVVFEQPQHPYTRALAAAFPTIGDLSSRMRPSGLDGDPPDPQHIPSGCPFHLRCDVREERCESLDVRLSPAGAGGRAACVKVGSVEAEVPA